MRSTRLFVACIGALLALLLGGCMRGKPLEPLPVPERIVITEYGKTEPGGDIGEALAIQRVVSFANALRAGEWTKEKTEHSACGTVVLTFRTQGKPLGYLAIDGERFFTNAPDGEVTQAATREKMDEFLALLPRWYTRSKCMG